MTFSEIIRSETPALVDFTATWCGPCKMQAPILADVKAMLGDSVRIIKVDIDKNPEASAQFQVQSVPTLILFKQGQVKWRQSGVVQARELKEIISRLG